MKWFKKKTIPKYDPSLTYCKCAECGAKLVIFEVKAETHNTKEWEIVFSISPCRECITKNEYALQIIANMVKRKKAKGGES